VHVPGDNFALWPVKGVDASMERKLRHNNVAHDPPKVDVPRV
jgi:hypothetical protein